MALLSMTGFGKREGTILGKPLSLEIRTVNGRYLELSIRLPRELSGLEGAIRQRLQERLGRGSVQCTLQFAGTCNGERSAATPALQKEVALEYWKISEELRSELGNSFPSLTAGELLTLPGVLGSSEKEEEEGELWSQLQPLLDEAIDKVVQHRRAEGENLKKELLFRLERLEELLQRVEKELPLRLVQAKERFYQRIQELLADQELDQQRMHQEVALLVDKLDVTEELVRFHSHNALFKECLLGAGPHGRRLGFLLQEMGREANTLGTKSQHSEMQHLVISLKEELEIMREQSLNVE